MATLRTGFTTGTAAAAAVKGALKLLLTAHKPEEVEIRLLTGDLISIPIHSGRITGKHEAICTVIKDAGDDPDVTHKAEIGAIVRVIGNNGSEVMISGGKGVGRVTKPGLEIPPGEPAINPGPRKMITQAVREVLAEHDLHVSVSAEIFVPKGEELARKTLNARLGILGGISILGTTGIVKPMSHEAYIASIESALSVARASGLETVVLTTGRRSERYAQLLWKELPEEAFVQMGDFFKASLESAVPKGFEHIRLAVFFGKALKMAQGFPHTHASKSELTMQAIADDAFSLTEDREFAEKLRCANTARHALEIIKAQYPEMIYYVGRKLVAAALAFCKQDVLIHAVIFDYDGRVIFESDHKFEA